MAKDLNKVIDKMCQLYEEYHGHDSFILFINEVNKRLGIQTELDKFIYGGKYESK